MIIIMTARKYVTNTSSDILIIVRHRLRRDGSVVATCRSRGAFLIICVNQNKKPPRIRPRRLLDYALIKCYDNHRSFLVHDAAKLSAYLGHDSESPVMLAHGWAFAFYLLSNF
jgi:hypothetical protein